MSETQNRQISIPSVCLSVGVCLSKQTNSKQSHTVSKVQPSGALYSVYLRPQCSALDTVYFRCEHGSVINSTQWHSRIIYTAVCVIRGTRSDGCVSPVGVSDGCVRWDATDVPTWTYPSASVNIRQRPSASVNIRQRLSASVVGVRERLPLSPVCPSVRPPRTACRRQSESGFRDLSRGGTAHSQCSELRPRSKVLGGRRLAARHHGH